MKFICEIGINHNADINVVKKLIDSAVIAGADYVKFQKRVPEISVPEHQKNVLKETPWGNITYLAYKKKLEFGKKEFEEIDRYCKLKKIKWFVSVWDVPSVKFMEQFKTDIYKIPSAQLTNDELLKCVKKTGKIIMLSTGMSTEEQIKHAVNILGEDGLIIMHCNSQYPAELKDLNLSYIKILHKHFPSAIIGYSGHEVGLLPSVVASILGAEYIERHITLNRAMWGTDQSSSVEPPGLIKLIRDIKTLPIIMGNGIKNITEGEKIVMKKLRGVEK